MGIHHMRELGSEHTAQCLRVAMTALQVLCGDFLGKFHQVVKLTDTQSDNKGYL